MKRAKWQGGAKYLECLLCAGCFTGVFRHSDIQHSGETNKIILVLQKRKMRLREVKSHL